jgi:hypothetical protein
MERVNFSLLSCDKWQSLFDKLSTLLRKNRYGHDKYIDYLESSWAVYKFIKIEHFWWPCYSMNILKYKTLD